MSFSGIVLFYELSLDPYGNNYIVYIDTDYLRKCKVCSYFFSFLAFGNELWFDETFDFLAYKWGKIRLNDFIVGR
jgi:hypothetical protein